VSGDSVLATRGGHRLRARWQTGQAAFGLWAAISSSLTVELAAAAGFDYVCVDMQHGLSDERAMTSMLQAIDAGGATSLVRVAGNEPWLIMRALDLGAAGVIVPLVNNAAEAARAVSACRYPPEGTRSYGPSRAELVLGTNVPAELAAAVLCFVMIETAEGLDRVDEIASVPGLDGLYIGPSDLSVSLGLVPRVGGPELEEAIVRVRETAHAHGLAAGMHCANGQAAAVRAGEGFELVTVAVDSSLYRAAIASELVQARGA
jgi:4-hydroxy-2-oxoheptanedioate aldolase